MGTTMFLYITFATDAEACAWGSNGWQTSSYGWTDTVVLSIASNMAAPSPAASTRRTTGFWSHVRTVPRRSRTGTHVRPRDPESARSAICGERGRSFADFQVGGGSTGEPWSADGARLYAFRGWLSSL
ncbi:hypothetical protein BD413DRAFT_570988 [Trametes elegans]|nr:hypothetical protein BD413DRAFT_570988 [Trametes elegans]